MSYQNKYIKYKNKYLDLKNQIGGTAINDNRSAAAHDVESTCSICLGSYNNTDRKPVGLHGTINAENITTSGEHFICTRCYHTNHDELSRQCPGCRVPIVPKNVKIYDYDINTHRIANPLVSIPYNKDYVLPSNSSCSLCLQEYNNTTKKPVGLHDQINFKKVVHSSDQHFVCLECFNKNVWGARGVLSQVRRQCVVCKDPIVELEAKIYNYNIEDKIVSDESLGFAVNPVIKFFKRIDDKGSRESGFGGGNSGRPEEYDHKYTHYSFLCTCNSPKPNCPCIDIISRHKLINKKLKKEDYDKLDVQERPRNTTWV